MEKKFVKYKAFNGNVGVDSYFSGEDFIEIRFINSPNTTYRYDFAKPGEVHVRKMKELAEKGRDLSKYISQNKAVKEGYIDKY